jgi:dsDNA-binding SOS-regulon protein
LQIVAMRVTRAMRADIRHPTMPTTGHYAKPSGAKVFKPNKTKPSQKNNPPANRNTIQRASLKKKLLGLTTITHGKKENGGDSTRTHSASMKFDSSDPISEGTRGGEQTPSKLTKLDLILSIAKRYPEEKDRERVALFLNSQFDALNDIENGDFSQESPRPPVPARRNVVEKARTSIKDTKAMDQASNGQSRNKDGHPKTKPLVAPKASPAVALVAHHGKRKEKPTPMKTQDRGRLVYATKPKDDALNKIKIGEELSHSPAATQKRNVSQKTNEKQLKSKPQNASNERGPSPSPMRIGSDSSAPGAQVSRTWNARKPSKNPKQGGNQPEDSSKDMKVPGQESKARSGQKKVSKLKTTRSAVGTTGSPTTVANGELTKNNNRPITTMDLILSIGDRFPEEKDRERLVLLLKSQQEALDQIENGTTSPRPPANAGEASADPSKTRVACVVPQPAANGKTSANKKAAPKPTVDTTSSKTQAGKVNRKFVASSSNEPSFRRPNRIIKPEQHDAWEPFQAHHKAPHAKAGLSERIKKVSNLRSAESQEGLSQPAVPKRVPVCQFCSETICASKAAKCSNGRHVFCQGCVESYVESFVYGDLIQLREIQNFDGCWFKALPCLSSQCGYFLSHELVQHSSKHEVWMAYEEKMIHAMSLDSRVVVAPPMPPAIGPPRSRYDHDHQRQTMNSLVAD